MPRLLKLAAPGAILLRVLKSAFSDIAVNGLVFAAIREHAKVRGQGQDKPRRFFHHREVSPAPATTVMNKT
jgi:hypothetical protein